jgi:thiamine-monophosphate kinase
LPIRERTASRDNGAVTREPRLRDEGEFELIALLAERLRRAGAGHRSASEVAVGIGDDASVTVPEAATATSTEALVDGVHFRRDTATPRSIGRKALAVALSDLAAMGARPGEAYVALGIPSDLEREACIELYDGLGEGAVESGTAVLGGDVTRSPVLLLAVTVVGHASGADQLVGRDGASPGEALAVTGQLGGAAAGLLLLERPALAASLDRNLAADLVRRQLEPTPRLGAGAALASHGATAMIDVSDGLGADAAQLAAASGVRAELELDRLPVQPGVRETAAAAELDEHDLAAAGGEDYELLAALPKDRVADATAAAAAAGIELTVIGKTAPGQGVEVRAPDGSTRAPAGFDHLRRGPPGASPR